MAWLWQITMSPYLKVNLVHPDWVFIVAISWFILRGWEEGFLLLLCAGLCLDLTSAVPFGLFTLDMMVIAITTYFLQDRILGRSNVALSIILILPLTLIFYGFALTGLHFTDQAIPIETTFTIIVVPAAMLNLVVMLPIFGLFYLLNRFLIPPETLIS